MRVALALTCIVGIGVAAGATGPSPAAAPATAPSFQRVIVTLRAQAELRGIRGPRASRLSQVVNALRAKAIMTQRALRFRLALLRAQGKVTRVQPLWVINALAVTASPDAIEELRRRPEVLSVGVDEEVIVPAAAAAAGAVEPGVAKVDAPAVWSAGFTGQDVVVASVDTGVSLAHAELASRWRGGPNSWYDPNGQHATPYDSSGHGTNTTGTMVAGNASGSAVGIAPGARWIAAKIFNDQGSASASAVHQAFQWLLDPDRNPATADAPDVVNNSWGNSYPGCSLTFDLDLRNLRAAGILPIFSAGNTGPGSSSSVSPANNPSAFAVGATTSADQIYTYSARGPSACGESSTTFPEIVAPGVSVRTTDRYGGYTTATGTSMAAPTAAGVLALLLDAYPELTVAQQQAALETAFDLGSAGPDNVFGRGRLDASAALASIGPPPPPVPDFTIGSVPASGSVDPGGTASLTVTVAAVNGFAGAVSLAVSGLPAGATAVFSPQQLDGSGTSGLTVATSSSTPPGEYPLTITGTSGSLSHETVSSLVVNAPPPPPDFVLATSPTSASTTQGGGVTYTVSIGSAGGFAGDVGLSLTGLPAGASASFAPAVVAGGAGSSQLSVTTSASTPVGNYALTVSGASGTLAHSAGVTLVVAPPPDFTLAASPGSTSVSAGGSVGFTVTVGSSNGFTQDVALSLSGLTPSQASWTFTPPTVSGGSGSAGLTIATSSSLAPGTYSLAVTGVSGSLSHTTPVTLVVAQATPSFALAVTPAATTIAAGQTAAYTVTVASSGGFSGSVSLSVTGAPGFSSWKFSVNPVVASGTSILSVRTLPWTSRGAFTIRITGKSGLITKQATATLAVM